ncbi:hypothetical protein [Bacillus sp. JCM 19034]|uniref:hypothetical protein n=1 Tax=Bacillus sp. JCM 19034 TaxID=1481928 RepID=UPI0012E10CC1|nr:hypothetical protein [Bacillus sp. JCM 19034]
MSIMSPSLNHFMFRSIVLLIVLNIPIVSFFQWFELSLLEWFPVYSSFFLIQFSLSGAQVDVSFIRHVVQLIFWGVLSFIWTYRCFQRYIVNDTGESKEVHI